MSFEENHPGVHLLGETLLALALAAATITCALYAARWAWRFIAS